MTLPSERMSSACIILWHLVYIPVHLTVNPFLFPLLLSCSLLLYSSSFYPLSLSFFLCRSFCICVGLLTQRQLVSLRAHSCIISNSFPTFFHLEHDGFATVKLVVFRNIGSITSNTCNYIAWRGTSYTIKIGVSTFAGYINMIIIA